MKTNTNPLDYLLPDSPVWEWAETRLIPRNKAATQTFPAGPPSALIALAENPDWQQERPWQVPSTRQRWMVQRTGPYLILKPHTRLDLSEKIRCWAELVAARQIHREGEAWDDFAAMMGGFLFEKKILSSKELVDGLLPYLSERLVKRPSAPLKWEEQNVGELWMEGNLEQLGSALAELYRNAQEATAGTIQLRIQSGHELEISVCHLHHGKDPATVWPERMGEPFITTKQDHSGIGLAKARCIAFLHQGELVWKKSPYGSEFTLLLPKTKSSR